jgi:hypothetical protein
VDPGIGIITGAMVGPSSLLTPGFGTRCALISCSASAITLSFSLLSPLSLYSPLVIDVSVRFFKEREMERGLKSGLSPSPPELNF